jgi:uncharacterized membrane protein (UPF0182 family)
MATIDWPARRRPRQIVRILLGVLLAAAFLGGATTVSYYVDFLWFSSLGYTDAFWTTLAFRAAIFGLFACVTFGVLFGAFLLLKPARLGVLAGRYFLVNGQPVSMPLEPAIRFAALGIALAAALVAGLGMMSQWTTFALYWHRASVAPGELDPIFGRPVAFYLFTLPVWSILAGWLTTLAVLACGGAVVLAVLAGGAQLAGGRRLVGASPLLRGVSAAFAAVLLMLAVQAYVGRFGRILADHTIFSGVTYTDANVRVTGMLLVAAALVLGAAIALVNAVAAPKLTWLIGSVVPAAACYAVVTVAAWYVNSFVVKPNELVREGPFIAHNIEMTRRAYALDRFNQQPFPAETSVEAADPTNNQDTLQNIRLWDWRALQDALRQIQAIRTYYDFFDIDIDRYEIDGTVRQMMLATRELDVNRLPESSRNWINEKLIYTHGYGVTMNPVNGFTPEGLPQLLLRNMPVESSIPGLGITRPEVYFGELTDTDVYVKTRQSEFNYPQGDANNVTSYEGTGGIVIGGFARRLLIALDRGDLTKLPFSDDVTGESRLLMRRNIVDRVRALAPFLTLDADPYIVIGDDGRLHWMIDAFTTSATYPYARHYRLGGVPINYLRNSVKVVVDAYNGSVDFYVFDADDPLLGAYRALFPGLFKDASAMPPSLRTHVRYPELLLEVQAGVYSLYHMSDPAIFYNREDLWAVASEVVMNEQREQATETMEANFVLMKLPGEAATEFVEILPFTPANRNNLIGWIAGRSDGSDYGTATVYSFPESRLVDGPLQIEARIDQNPQLSAQLSLWNQQGSSVRRGSLIVIPVGRALLYAEPIYLQAARSPMPELRIVVLALQDRLAYGPTFDAAMAALFGGAPSTLPGALPNQPAVAQRAPTAGAQGARPPGADTLIGEAARDLADYQRLTAEGRLGEAGQKLEALKEKLDELQRQRR